MTACSSWLALFWSYQSQWKFCCWFAWKKGQAWLTDSFALPCRHANQWQNSFLYCSWHLARFVLLRFCNSWYAVSMITLNYTRWLVKDSELPTTKSSNEYLLGSHIHFSLKKMPLPRMSVLWSATISSSQRHRPSRCFVAENLPHLLGRKHYCVYINEKKWKQTRRIANEQLV